MLARVSTFAIAGLEPRHVWVEVDIRPGLPSFTIVGLGDAAVREARERVRAAVLNSGFEFPQRRITANLAPAHLRKVGPGFDLALAAGVLAASGQLPGEALAHHAVFGELSLGGELRPCRGTLAVAEGTARAGLTGLILPHELAAEAALVEGIAIAAVPTLRAVVEILGGAAPPPLPDPAQPVRLDHHDDLDLADVRGQGGPRRALELAAAGGHNLLLEGAPGTGKTMLARRLPSILPPLTREEALEVTRIHSVAGLHPGAGLVPRRPFRAPHHTISAAGLVGGGALPAPGEVTLAHEGVLFLDEIAEFPRASLEALRQPLEDGRIAIVRGQRTAVFPARVMLVASTNPCPCGYAGVGGGDRCSCSEGDQLRYRRRLSGPLLDRLDLLVTVERPTAAELAGRPGEDSATVRRRVEAARERQARRLAGAGVRCNAQMSAALVAAHVRPSPEARALLGDAYDRRRLSARAHHRILRVAQTAADLGAAPRVEREHVMTALGLRGHDAEGDLAA